jgi:iron complex transport system ATP-binding protein
MKLSIAGVAVDIERQRIVDEVSFEVPSGAIVGIVGPNGSGKTTLLKTVYRTLSPTTGTVWIDDTDLHRLSIRESARRIAAVLQEQRTELEFTVRDVVAMGRTPHKRLFDPDRNDDHQLVDSALHRVGIARLAGRAFATLSGGEKQRALIARAVVQQAQLLVLDEPTNHLDVRYQLEIMDLLGELGMTTLVALHDLNIAATYCTTVHVMRAGRVVAAGPPETIFTPELVREVFGVDAAVVRHPTTGAIRLLYDSPRRAAAASTPP